MKTAGGNSVLRQNHPTWVANSHDPFTVFCYNHPEIIQGKSLIKVNHLYGINSTFFIDFFFIGRNYPTLRKKEKEMKNWGKIFVLPFLTKEPLPKTRDVTNFNLKQK